MLRKRIRTSTTTTAPHRTGSLLPVAWAAVLLSFPPAFLVQAFVPVNYHPSARITSTAIHHPSWSRTFSLLDSTKKNSEASSLLRSASSSSSSSSSSTPINSSKTGKENESSSSSRDSKTKDDDDVMDNNSSSIPLKEAKKKPAASPPRRRKMELMWCGKDYCKDVIRERVVDEHVLLNGPATGQVAYYWDPSVGGGNDDTNNNSLTRYVLLLVKPGNDELLRVAAEGIKAWTTSTTPSSTTIDDENDSRSETEQQQRQYNNKRWNDKIHVMLDPTLAARLEHNFGVRSDCIHLFEPQPTPGFGSHLRKDHRHQYGDPWDPDVQESIPTTFGDIVPDLIVTLGGDGLLMHASMMFQGPIPPILCVAGGSLGFLTPFTCDEMVDAVRIALGLTSETQNESLLNGDSGNAGTTSNCGSNADVELDHVFPPNMPSYPYDPLPKNPNTFGAGGRICLSIRMRLCCQIMNREAVVRAQYNVLNEVVIDRGSSPYLAALECFCDDVHLTTVQADGIIFGTPTGSTAYSMAAGGSVVHPAVPCIMVTPICPHVLSFRSMVFPDHVVLRCYVPDDARATASVAFDGKHRQELRRGESVQIRLSAYPVPTLNRHDHSSDWLGSLKRNFNFNARPRQKPL